MHYMKVLNSNKIVLFSSYNMADVVDILIETAIIKDAMFIEMLILIDTFTSIYVKLLTRYKS